MCRYSLEESSPYARRVERNNYAGLDKNVFKVHKQQTIELILFVRSEGFPTQVGTHYNEHEPIGHQEVWDTR